MPAEPCCLLAMGFFCWRKADSMPNPKDFDMDFRPETYWENPKPFTSVEIAGKTTRVIPFDPDQLEDYLDEMDDEEEIEDPNLITIAPVELESVLSDFKLIV